MARTPAQRTGDRGEKQALKHLERAGGHRCVARNFAPKPELASSNMTVAASF